MKLFELKWHKQLCINPIDVSETHQFPKAIWYSAGVPDVTWVTEDFIVEKNATTLPNINTGQFISVHCGQQVEIIDSNLPSLPEFCLVRIIGSSQTTDTCSPNSTQPQEGIVPLCAIRFSKPANNSSKSALMEAEDVTTLCNESSPSFSSESTGSTKRRGTFKKWLTNPVRKLSQGRVEKSANNNSNIDSPKSGTKKFSPNTWKVNKEEATYKTLPNLEENISENKANLAVITSGASNVASQTTKPLDLNGGVINTTEEDGDVTDVELPPPMKIQDHSYPPVTVSTLPTVSADETSDETHSHSEDKAESNEPSKDLGFKEMSCIDENSDDVCDETDNSSSEISEKEKALNRRKFVLQELVDTERDYVRDLGCVVDGYLELMRREVDVQIPEDLKNGKDKIIFGNIEAIYEWHRDSFCAEIEKCFEEPERLGLLFRRYERRLNMYVVYCQNKPKSEHIVSEYLDTFFEDIRQKLGHKLQLPDLLIKPVQRITKYQLLLRDILKFTEKAGLVKESEDLRKAVHIMHIVPKAANDMMMVGRLQNFDGKITAQGKLLQQGALLIGDMASVGGASGGGSGSASGGSIKLKERQVFLFEQIIIFSEAVGPRTQFSYPVYIYKNHLQVNKMSLLDKVEDGDPNKFILKSKDPQQEGVAFVCQVETKEERDDWVSNIKAILDTQLDFLRALQSPIAYQKELTKEVSAPELGSLWNPSLRKTLSHPAAVHREKSAKSLGTGEPALGSSTTSKSMRQTNKSKNKGHISVTECETIISVNNSDAYSDSTHLDSSNRKYSCPVDKPPPSSQKLQSQSSPSKAKRTFLEGFKNPLRQKKIETTCTTISVTSEPNNQSCNLLSSHSLDSASGAQRRNKLDASRDNSVIRRWSESATPHIITTSSPINNSLQPNSNTTSNNYSPNCVSEKHQ